MTSEPCWAILDQFCAMAANRYRRCPPGTCFVVDLDDYESTPLTENPQQRGQRDYPDLDQ